MTKNDRNAISALILDELQSYERFCIWVEANYQIHLLTNDEEERVEVKVIENDINLAQENLARAVKNALDNREDKIQVVGADVLKKLENNGG